MLCPGSFTDNIPIVGPLASCRYHGNPFSAEGVFICLLWTNTVLAKFGNEKIK